MPPKNFATPEKMPFMVFHILLQIVVTAENIVLIALTAPLNIFEKKFITGANTFLSPFQMPLATLTIAENTDFTTETTLLNKPPKKSIAPLNTPTITSQALPNISPTPSSNIGIALNNPSTMLSIICGIASISAIIICGNAFTKAIVRFIHPSIRAGRLSIKALTILIIISGSLSIIGCIISPKEFASVTTIPTIPSMIIGINVGNCDTSVRISDGNASMIPVNICCIPAINCGNIPTIVSIN